jgi:ureidoacrylate peracid hydrolase
MRQSISVEARPAPLTLDPSTTAVIVVDMQNDFASKGGMLDRAGIDVTGTRALAGPIANVLKAAREAGSRVIYLKMEFRPDLSDLGAADSSNAMRHRFFGVGESVPAPDGTEGRFLVRDTWNTEIIDELKPQPGDLIVSKHRFSGFFGTDLDTILRTLGIQTLVFTGCTTSICVESTLRDAQFRDYVCLLLSDCTAEPMGSDLQRTNHEASLLLVERLFGWVTESRALVEALESKRIAAASR